LPDPDKGSHYTIKTNCSVRDISGQTVEYSICFCNEDCGCGSGGNLVQRWFCIQGSCHKQWTNTMNGYPDQGQCNANCPEDDCEGYDCAGVCGGSSVLDCADVCNGDNVLDECSVCDSDSSNDCVQDCAGVWGGSTVLDECMVCGGDGSTCVVEECEDTNDCVEIWGDWYNIETTTYLDLSNTQRAGEIPPEIGNLTNLIFLKLSNNQLTGTIPSWLVNLMNLTHLQLDDNQLTGEIPVGFGNMPNLACFRVSSNQLTGTLPTDIANINSNTICNCAVDVRDNQLSGELFLELCDLWYICGVPIHPKFSGNKFCPDEFTGEWPLCGWPMDGTYMPEDEVFYGTRLRNDMGYQNTSECPGYGINWLTDCNGYAYPVGGIPEFVNLWENFGGDCYNVAEPTSNNQLMLGYDLEHGQTIPPEIGLLTSLTRLALQSNGLIGGIPSEIGYLTNLTRLWLKNNQLSGEIPQQVCDLIESNNLDMDDILAGNNLINNC